MYKSELRTVEYSLISSSEAERYRSNAATVYLAVNAVPKKGWFHEWARTSQIYALEDRTEIIHDTRALIETETGEILQLAPDKIRFLD